ncbi:MAG: trigger factor [Alphaproteobacteria bacterium]|nr:trigger factor [Alphaproteobacteria bacterium]
MQVTETSSEGLKREFRIVVGADDIERRLTSKLNELGQRVRLPGFRPGKVPPKLLRQQYGKAVMSEVLEEAVNAGAQKAVADNSLRPALQPRVEVTRFEDGADLEYTVAIEVLPDIVPGDFGAIQLEKLVVNVDDAQVEQALERLANQQKTFKVAPEGKAAASGDAVLIDFVGKKDGVAFEGGSAQDHQLELGSGAFIPGFEDQLVGAKAGEAREVKVTFPEAYGNTDLAGKEAVFEVTVKEVREAEPVAVDDELAKRYGFENLEGLRKAVREQIQQEHGQITRNRLKRSLLDALAGSHDFPVPAGMVDLEFEQIWKQAEQDPEMAAAPEEDKDKQKGEYRAIAERRVRLGLLLSEVGRLNNIDVKPEEVTRAMMEQARRFPGQERQVMEYFQKTPEAMAQLRAPIYEDKVVDFILELAKVTERPVSAEELLRDPEDAGKDA